jgi:hypothetical protein
MFMYNTYSSQLEAPSIELQVQLMNDSNPVIKRFAHVLSILAHHQICYPAVFTKAQLKDWLKPYGIGKKYVDEKLRTTTIKNAQDTLPLLHKLQPEEWQIQDDTLILTPNFPDFIITDLSQKIDLNKINIYRKKEGKKGRLPDLYTIYPYWVYSQFLEIQRAKLMFLDIPEENLRSTREYRKYVLRAFIETYPGEHSRQQLANQIGVSKRTTRTYTKELEAKITHNFKEKQLHNVKDFKRYAEYDWMFLIDNDTNTVYHNHIKNFQRIQQLGHDASIRWRSSNSYYLGTVPG